MATNKVTVNCEAEYRQAFVDQEALGFSIKNDNTKDFVGVLIFHDDNSDKTRRSGKTFQNDRERITFLLNLAGYDY